jgi:hypothetical protein
LADKQLASNKGLMGGWDRWVLEIKQHIEVQCIVVMVIYAMGLGWIFLPDYLWESPQAACAFFFTTTTVGSLLFGMRWKI